MTCSCSSDSADTFLKRSFNQYQSISIGALNQWCSAHLSQQHLLIEKIYIRTTSAIISYYIYRHYALRIFWNLKRLLSEIDNRSTGCDKRRQNDKSDQFGTSRSCGLHGEKRSVRPIRPRWMGMARWTVNSLFDRSVLAFSCSRHKRLVLLAWPNKMNRTRGN